VHSFSGEAFEQSVVGTALSFVTCDGSGHVETLRGVTVNVDASSAA